MSNNLSSSFSKILGSAVEVVSSITEGIRLVVVEQALPPHLPRISVGELWDGSIQESDGRPTVVVVRDPQHGLVDSVIPRVHQAPAYLIAGAAFCYFALVHPVHLLPHVHHVKFVYHSLQRAPIRAQPVVILPDIVQDLVDHVHRVRGEIVTQRVTRGERNNLLWRMTIHIDGGYVVIGTGSRIEHLQTLNCHGMNGVSNGFIKVFREPILDQQLAAVLAGDSQPYHEQ